MTPIALKGRKCWYRGGIHWIFDMRNTHGPYEFYISSSNDPQHNCGKWVVAYECEVLPEEARK